MPLGTAQLADFITIEKTGSKGCELAGDLRASLRVASVCVCLAEAAASF